jgi:hypothetical protein
VKKTLRPSPVKEWLLRNPAGDEIYLRLEPGETLAVGRDLSSDLTILDAGVSRHQASFTLEPDGLWLEDLHSQNGTFVNMEPIRRVMVHSGDVITFGRVSLTLIARDAAADESDPLPGLSRERIEAILRALRDLALHRSREKVLRKLLAASMEPLSADRGAIFLCSKERKGFELAAASPQEFSRMIRDFIGPALAESMLRDRKARICPVDATGLALAPPGAASGQASAARSAIIAPLHAGAGPLGLLYIDAPIDSRSFIPEDAEYLLTLAWAASPLVDASSDLAAARDSQRRLEDLMAERNRELGDRGAVAPRARTGDRTPGLLLSIEARLTAAQRLLAGIDGEAADSLEEGAVILSAIRRLEDRRSSRFEEMQIAHALSVALVEDFHITAGGDLCVAGAPDELFAALRLARRLLSAGSGPGGRTVLCAAASTESPAWVWLQLERSGEPASSTPLLDDMVHLLRRLAVEHLQGALEVSADGSSLRLRLPHAARALQETAVVDAPG